VFRPFSLKHRLTLPVLPHGLLANEQILVQLLGVFGKKIWKLEVDEVAA